MYKYIKQYGEFYLIDDKTGDYHSYKGEKVIGIAVSIDSETNIFCLHKHGGYDWVKEWVEKTKETYNKNGFSEIADEIRLIRVENCLLEDLNKILDTSALPVSFLEKLETTNI